MFVEHQAPCLIQPHPFLVLQGAHCGELAQVMVHADDGGRRMLTAKEAEALYRGCIITRLQDSRTNDLVEPSLGDVAMSY